MSENKQLIDFNQKKAAFLEYRISRAFKESTEFNQREVWTHRDEFCLNMVNQILSYWIDEINQETAKLKE